MADPGLPRPNPTQSYWQQTPHALADVQSSELPTDRDFAIIGSGITGLAVTKSLLERHPTATVTVLEARTLCSGATGRNGGQMAANAGEQYMHLAETHGSETAGKIVDFTFRNLGKMQELAEEYDAVESSEMQQLHKLRVFLTQGKFDDFKKSIARLEKEHPSKKGLYTILDADSVAKVGCLKASGNFVAVLTFILAIWNSWNIWRSSSSCRDSLAISSCHQGIRGTLGEIPKSTHNRNTHSCSICGTQPIVYF